MSPRYVGSSFKSQRTQVKDAHRHDSSVQHCYEVSRYVGLYLKSYHTVSPRYVGVSFKSQRTQVKDAHRHDSSVQHCYEVSRYVGLYLKSYHTVSPRYVGVSFKSQRTQVKDAHRHDSSVQQNTMALLRSVTLCWLTFKVTQYSVTTLCWRFI